MCATAAAVGLLSISPVSAFAAFTRPFLGQITSVSEPLGVAVYREVPGQEDDVWISSSDTALEEFSAAYEGNVPISHVPTVKPGAGSLAAERVSGAFYRGSGSVHRVGFVAVDNSPPGTLDDPSACGPEGCIHYASEYAPEEGDGIKKLNSKDEPVAFECQKPQCEYVEGDKITGIPGDPVAYRGGPIAHPDHGEGVGGIGGAGIAVAVDSKGDIYAAGIDEHVVYEFAPSGDFVRAFELNEEEVPLLGDGLARGEVAGLAVDSVSGHLLVSVQSRVATVGGEEYAGGVDEFEVGSGRFVAQITQSVGGARFERPVGLAVDSRGDVYVVEQARGVVLVFGAGAYDPTVTLGEVDGKTGSSAVLNGVVNPAQEVNVGREASLKECYFQYVSEAEFVKSGFSSPETQSASCEDPDAGEIPTEREEEHAVKARVSDVQPGVTYRYRLVAVTGGASGGAKESSVLSFTAPTAAGIESTWAGDVSSRFAELHAQIDPLGADTSYRFEYLTSAAFAADSESFSGPDPAASVPVSDETIGAGGPSGSSIESVLQRVGGLSPGTEYRFRVVASNEIEEAGIVVYGPQTSFGVAGAFTTLPAPAPDGRAYELVTPEDKEGGSDMFAEPDKEGFVNAHNDGIAAESGGGFFLETFSAFGGFPFAAEQGYVFHRELAKGGWTDTPLADPSLGVQEFVGHVLDTYDLSSVAFGDLVGSSLSGTGARVENLIGAPGGPYAELHADTPIFRDKIEEESADTRIVGGSRELASVVLESNGEPFAGEGEGCPGARGVTHGDVLCEYAGGEFRLVNVKPGSVSDAPVSACGAILGSIAQGPHPRLGSAYRAVSADGSRVFFSAPSPAGMEGEEGCWNRDAEKEGAPPENAPQLYVRVRETEPPGEYVTIKISAPEKRGVVEYPTYYGGASEDGTDVFFVTKTELTKEAVELKLHNQQLYECEIIGEAEAEPRCRLTRVSAGDSGEHDPYVSEVYTVAAQGTAVYFNASDALAPGAPSTGGVYRYDTQTGVTSYVASAAGWEGTSRGDSGGCPSVGEVAPCSITNWYTTPDGRYALFIGPTGQLERYDGQAAEEGEPALVCVSCAAGGVEAGGEFARSATIGPADGPVRGMSENGEYVFFDTSKALVAQATNDTLDTYEWHDGVISLIGSGSNPSPTYFLGYSPYYYTNSEGRQVKVEGGNVFIGTHAQLVPQDTDSLGDVYDARVCEPESPCIEPPHGETAQCEGGSCQSPPAAPMFQSPATLTLASSGNLTSEAPSTKTPTAAEVRAKDLAKALKACKRQRAKRRAECEASARKKYGAAKKAKKSSKREPKRPSRSDLEGGR
jgi:hypothetical protein